MDDQVEKKVIDKLQDSKLEWEKVPERNIYRTETQGFAIYIDLASEAADIHVKRKNTIECCKIHRFQYNGGPDWQAIISIKNTIEKSVKASESYLLDEFIKDNPKDTIPSPKTVYVEDDLMDNTRTA